ncbi:hypothetical protein RYX36_004922 [Vicia faba]
MGGRFHACGIKIFNHRFICWGFIIKRSTSIPSEVKVHEIAAGDYFTCGVLAERKPLRSVYWSVDFPTSLPLPVLSGLCKPSSCPSGFYDFDKQKGHCESPSSGFCKPCSGDCPVEMYLKGLSPELLNFIPPI